MKKKSIIISLIICILVIIIVSFINMKIIYLGSYTKVLSFGNTIFKFNNNNSILLRNAKIYKNGNIINGYIKSSKSGDSSDYYIASKNNRIIDFDYLIASGVLTNIDVIQNNNVIDIDNNSLSIINNLLNENINIDNVYNYNRISCDIDNDSIEEDIISIIYYENDSIKTNIFINKNNSITNIINNEYSYEEESISNIYNFVGLIDFNKDKKYEIIISNRSGDSQPTYFDIYRYENDNIKEIK